MIESQWPDFRRQEFHDMLDLLLDNDCSVEFDKLKELKDAVENNTEKPKTAYIKFICGENDWYLKQ